MQKGGGQGDGNSFIHYTFLFHNFQILKWDKDFHFLHYNIVYNLHVIVLCKYASIMIIDVAFWHHTQIIIIYEMSFCVSNLAYLVIDSHSVSSCCFICGCLLF